MMPGGFHHRDLKRSDSVPGWVRVVAAAGALIALGAVCAALLASSLLGTIVWAATGVVALVAGGLVWLYFSASDRMVLPLHGPEQSKQNSSKIQGI